MWPRCSTRSRRPWGSSAGSGAIFHLRSNHLRPAGWTSADAAGLPILPGLARYDEVARGVIDHALRFTAPCTAPRYVYPARLARIAVTCRAHGLRPIDGPFGDFTDPEGFIAAARRAAVLGYEGKWAIHPSQIELANDVFTPDARLIDRTHRIIAAMKDAAAEGRGAVSLDGRLIDAASIRMAEKLLAKLEQIEARRAGIALRQVTAAG